MRVMPPGSEPAATDHAYGGTPPDAWPIAEYGTEGRMEGNGVVAITRGGVTVRVTVREVLCGVGVVASPR